MKLKNVIVIALVLSFSIPFYLGCSEKAKTDTPAKISKAVASEAKASYQKAADFLLRELEGKMIKLSDYKGKVIILDFWATWCPPCVQEIPHFNELAKEYAEKGLIVLGVSVDRGGVDVVKKFIKDKIPINYPIVIADKETHSKYQSYLPKDEQGGIPFTFIIDRKGNVRDHYVGYRPKEVFVEAITPLL
ncbi:MAG: TlpA disulfide reductase family protein [Candidatus Hatepunaea meridiana]|nr:TlpA disulfide reductase family protein [Candidatus Hatepunaea meridiana]